VSGYELSADGMTLTVTRPAPGGHYVATYERMPGAGPFTQEDIALALEYQPSAGAMPGQHNRTIRRETRLGTLYVRVMTGPPAWRLPKLRLEKDGTVMAGWLQRAAAVKLETSWTTAAWRLAGFSFVRQRYRPDMWTVHFHGRPHWDEEAQDYVAANWNAPVSLGHQLWPKSGEPPYPHSWNLRLWHFSARWWGK
jgi:hypothetical protein